MVARRLLLLVAIFTSITVEALGCSPGCNCTEFSVGYHYHVGYLYGKRYNCTNLGLSEVPSDMSHNNHINVLYLSDNNITHISNDSFYRSENIVILHLENNSISVLESGAFQGLSKLMAVFLGSNKLTYLHPETFSYNSKLLVLDLGHNMFNIPASEPFIISDDLLSLSVAGCNLSNISEQTFKKIKNLVTVDISSNDLKTFSLSIFDGHIQIKNLILRNNTQTLKIEGSFPSTMEKLDFSGSVLDLENFPPIPFGNHIELLCLNSCNLTEIPISKFNRLTSLEELQLSNNKLTKSSLSTIKLFRNVKRLYLDYNSIDFIDVNTFSSFYIWKIVLSGNPIDFPQKGPFLITSDLQMLEMRSCSITHLGNETFKELKSLNYTDLSHNHIKHIGHDVFTGLDSLTMLLLQNNQITVIEKDAFLHNIKLTTLDLSGNPLVIPTDTPILSAPSLKTLALASCGITQLPIKTFSHSLQLDHLDISQNKLRFIDDQVFAKLKKIRYLNMSDNPFVCDYLLRPLWLLCLDRDIECVATCGQSKESWNVLEDVTPSAGIEELTTTEGQPIVTSWRNGEEESQPLAVQQPAGKKSVAPTVILMLCIGFIVGTVIGLVAGCIFLKKYLGIHRDENAVYHSVAAESITAGSLQQLCIDERN